MALKTIEKYGRNWDASISALAIELSCYRNGIGNGPVFHYDQIRKTIWPELDDHRWHLLCREELIKNSVTVLMGAASSSKTHSAAVWGLIEYFSGPNDTTVLVSSTDMRGLELRVWGEIKSLFERAIERFPFLSGNLLESKHAIATSTLEEQDDVRDLRNGIIGIPCIQGGRFVGLGRYSGIKNKHVRLVADEAQFMGTAFLASFANLDKNADFKAAVLGNPNDPLDPLGKAAEPRDGWSAHMQPEKTECWDTRFMNGRCVNLVGTDSPNFDYPADQPTRYKYLISREKIERTVAFFGRDSFEYFSQCLGVMKIGVLARRVLTRDLVRTGKAQELVTWKGTPTTKVYFVDAAYGGDRCVAGVAEFGEDVDSNIILAFGDPRNIPIIVGNGVEPEYQIANFVREDCETLNVPPSNMGHDATGRGSLGTALAKVWSANTNPVESGGVPTQRPVTLDMFILDPKTKQRRLKRCDEHYDRRVTEFWFSVRYATEAGQLRNLPDECLEDLCARKWDMTRNDKRSLELKDGSPDGSPNPRRVGFKQRMGRSPDYGDWAAGIVEMARRRGFNIVKLSNDENDEQNWSRLKELQEDRQKFHKSKALNFTA